MLVLYSSNVENSETSSANSSFNSGNSLLLNPFNSTANTASLPESSGAWYASGNVTLTSNLSPTLCPTICSSKPSIKA